jgi:hypothetical protein
MMRRLTLMVLLAAAVTVLHAARVVAQMQDETDNARFRRYVSRYAPEVGKPARAICVCQDGSANQGRAGELRQVNVNQVVITCAIPAFDGLGHLGAYDTCRTWAPLAR